ALWTKFEETYPNGMKKTSFMARLADCSHIKYREDLGGLCLICNDYGFEAFQDLIAIARSTFNDKKRLDDIISRIENLRRHMKRNFERELVINQDGTVSHLYAFEECKYHHISRCTEFRKVYLNAQFKSSLAQLDKDGAIIVVDYKMRILLKSARETKEQFFGKRGWTLHTILIFTKKDDEMKLDKKKPKWISVISDNGPHYHNSELMSIVAYWYDWYQIQVRSWLFLESGEAKTTIDSHHTSISHTIKRYIQIGYDIKGDQDIVEVGKNLAGTYFANIEPNRNENNENSEQMNNNTRKKKKPKVKTISGISKYFYWEWPTEGLLAASFKLPQPTLSIHTQATSTWTIPIPQLNVDVSDDIIDIANQPNNQSDTENNSCKNPNWQHPTANSIDENFQLPKGWALKQNQIFGRKGSGKRMTKKVKSLLELFSLNGNINLQDKLNAQEMHDELLKYVETEEIEEQDVPKVSTIQGWIVDMQQH
ncbi:unnamed protein product, partial [Rhizophagus irregularis]